MIFRPVKAFPEQRSVLQIINVKTLHGILNTQLHLLGAPLDDLIAHFLNLLILLSLTSCHLLDDDNQILRSEGIRI